MHRGMQQRGIAPQVVDVDTTPFIDGVSPEAGYRSDVHYNSESSEGVDFDFQQPAARQQLSRRPPNKRRLRGVQFSDV